MIIVDSSVWIDYFRGAAAPTTAKLDSILGIEAVGTGDLIMTEVLQGFRSDSAFKDALDVLCSTYVLELGGQRLALRAARHYRKLRRIGITPRKTIDTIIAPYCIDRGYSLLYSDRDFAPFVSHLGLRSAMSAVL
ncbi:PIN domain nuclease [Massilia terrae]|uniref:Ribonuclease VapC n=1 Tax=Massilia terrae TaxID=1811224 RepID=A0ABT2D227_9BURK|nr:PIN domain nuclease [Massilia terrae]MCS0660314.1 PIN domain nuclease [Massilia terrae]